MRNRPVHWPHKGPDGFYWILLNEDSDGGVHWAILGPAGTVLDSGRSPDLYGRNGPNGFVGAGTKNLHEVSKQIYQTLQEYFEAWTETDGIPRPPTDWDWIKARNVGDGSWPADKRLADWSWIDE